MGFGFGFSSSRRSALPLRCRTSTLVRTLWVQYVPAIRSQSHRSDDPHNWNWTSQSNWKFNWNGIQCQFQSGRETTRDQLVTFCSKELLVEIFEHFCLEQKKHCHQTALRDHKYLLQTWR